MRAFLWLVFTLALPALASARSRSSPAPAGLSLPASAVVGQAGRLLPAQPDPMPILVRAMVFPLQAAAAMTNFLVGPAPKMARTALAAAGLAMRGERHELREHPDGSVDTFSRIRVDVPLERVLEAVTRAFPEFWVGGAFRDVYRRPDGSILRMSIRPMGLGSEVLVELLPAEKRGGDVVIEGHYDGALHGRFSFTLRGDSAGGSELEERWFRVRPRGPLALAPGWLAWFHQRVGTSGMGPDIERWHRRTR